MTLTSRVETLSPWPRHEGMMANAMLGIRPDFAMSPKKTARFPRSARLLRHADFERVYKEGRRHFSTSLTVFYLARVPADVVSEELPTPHGLRVGFTVGRTLGGAVERNRMKRRLREAVRLSYPVGRIAADVVMNPKKSLLTADFASILNQVSRAFAIVEQNIGEQKLSPGPGTARSRNADSRP